jgi:hypothetical protein
MQAQLVGSTCTFLWGKHARNNSKSLRAWGASSQFMMTTVNAFDSMESTRCAFYLNLMISTDALPAKQRDRRSPGVRSSVAAAVANGLANVVITMRVIYS